MGTQGTGEVSSGACSLQEDGSLGPRRTRDEQALGFRNNAAYDRWWEGRKQWGALIIEVRAFTHTAIALLDDGRAELPEAGRQAARRLVHRTIAFPYALAAHLRSQDAGEVMGRFLAEPERSRVLASANRPNALLREHQLDLGRLLRAGHITDITWRALNERVHATVFGLDILSDEMEEPSARRPTTCPLLAMSRTTEINMLEALGEPQPEPLRPKDFILG
ncbi:bestrophin family protein [Corallococcus sp. EGB]|uniref:bestrophin family protein n=1 Tax=Corallococcus sp. EGB TaxID=1521117 RepID=UPI001CBBAF37|nr:bestrophin family protein [Corallococcus sp. EGB]